jgi:AcrR family transcriptional regulator
MGIKERQERDREAVRRAILDAARELFVAEGFQNVSIRKIAERIEYSPAAIYGYFPSKDDIFFSLAEEGFRLLGDPAAVREDPVLKHAPPLDRVRAVFWRLFQFSREQPEYFALMFVERSVPRISREYERFAFASADGRRAGRRAPEPVGTAAARRKSRSARGGRAEPYARRPAVRRDAAVAGRRRLSAGCPCTRRRCSGFVTSEESS